MKVTLTEPVPPDLEALAASTARQLKWAGFLLGAMLLVLLIDVQLKRSIARQAIEVSTLISKGTSTLVADLKGDGGGRRETLAAPGDHPGVGGADDVGGVDGSPGVAAGAVEADGQGQGVPGAAPARPGKRPPGNGRRAGGTAGG